MAITHISFLRLLYWGYNAHVDFYYYYRNKDCREEDSGDSFTPRPPGRAPPVVMEAHSSTPVERYWLDGAAEARRRAAENAAAPPVTHTL